MKTILAWHWSDGLKCQFDGRPIVPGETLLYEGQEPIERCKRGLHASPKILDALAYAPGTTISRVRLSGRILRDDVMIVATHRTCLWAFDAKYVLISWAADCAERALLREREAGSEPDPSRLAAIEAARKFVKDPTEENRLAGRHFSDEAFTDEIYAYLQALRAASVVARVTGQVSSPLPTGHRGGAAHSTANAVIYAAEEAKFEAYRKERKWQSAHLRNLIAAGRAVGP